METQTTEPQLPKPEQPKTASVGCSLSEGIQGEAGAHRVMCSSLAICHANSSSPAPQFSSNCGCFKVSEDFSSLSFPLFIPLGYLNHGRVGHFSQEVSADDCSGQNRQASKVNGTKGHTCLRRTVWQCLQCYRTHLSPSSFTQGLPSTVPSYVVRECISKLLTDCFTACKGGKRESVEAKCNGMLHSCRKNKELPYINAVV